MSELSDLLVSELLQSVNDTMESMAFSPDSGVSSYGSGECSEPSSPTLSLSSSGSSSFLTSDPSTQHFTELSLVNAAFLQDSQNSPVESWLQYDNGTEKVASGDFSVGDYNWQQLQPESVHHNDIKDWLLKLPASANSLASTCSQNKRKMDTNCNLLSNGNWQKTKAGFQICHTGAGSAHVKLAGGTYDIDTNIDINLQITDHIKQEVSSGEYGQTMSYASEICTENTFTAVDSNNNNINNSNDMLCNSTASMSGCYRYYTENGCHDCVQNRGYSLYENSGHHCSAYQYDDLHHQTRAENVVPRPPVRARRQSVRTERLWEFILRLLGDPKHNPRLIEWMDREDGTFRLNNSKAIARMWGMRKNNEQMTYEKLSRALRYYYHRQILEPVLGKKLVYRFGPNAVQVWYQRQYRPQEQWIRNAKVE